MLRPARFTATLLVSLVVLACRGVPSDGAQVCQTMSIPAYFYPGPMWDQAIAAAPKVGVMVMNPASGPGAASDPNYVSAVNRAKARGIAVLGYVHTSYAQRDPALVRADIDRYRAWYGVSGIFLDEVASSAATLPYYSDLASYIRAQPGQKVWLNPGVAPDQGYMSVGDVIVVFEGTYSSYLALRLPSWIAGHPASRFAHLVHATGFTSLQKAMDLSKSRNAGHVYVTDDRLPNPWDRLPAYWTQELNALCR